jgi:hypothetical protein
MSSPATAATDGGTGRGRGIIREGRAAVERPAGAQPGRRAGSTGRGNEAPVTGNLVPDCPLDRAPDAQKYRKIAPP